MLSLRAPVAAALACAALTGCGDEEPAPPDEPPRVLLERALAQPIVSGEAAIDLRAQVGGSSLLSEPATLALDGPFAMRGAAVPRFDLEAEAEVAGYGLDGELVSDGDDAFVVFFGENYRLGTDHVDNADATLRRAVAGGLRVQPVAWVAGPRHAGSDEVDGDGVHVIEGELRPGTLGDDLLAISGATGLSSPAAVADRLGSGTVEVLVEPDGGPLRGLRLDAELRGGGGLELSLLLSDLGAEQEIERPEGGGFQAVEELLARFERLAGVRIRF